MYCNEIWCYEVTGGALGGVEGIFCKMEHETRMVTRHYCSTLTYKKYLDTRYAEEKISVMVWYFQMYAVNIRNDMKGYSDKSQPPLKVPAVLSLLGFINSFTYLE